MFRIFAPLFVMLSLPASAWELAICANPAGLPYSQQDGTGFDNRIAAIIADELGAEPRFEWMPDHRLRTARGFLHDGTCDIVMGVIDGQKGLLTSHAYYRTTYVFVTRANGPKIGSLDDPAISGLRIGVPGGARQTTPPDMGLMRRGHMSRITHFGGSAVAGETERKMLDALESGEIDLAILWGPQAGHVLHEGHVATAVAPEIDIPFLPMFASLSVGVRPKDEALRDAIDLALSARWDEIQTALTDARVPQLYLPRPMIFEAGQ